MPMPPKQDSVAAVLKVFAVLEALAEDRTVSLTELSQRAMTSKSTAYRLLQTMQELGYVEQEGDTEKYGLTLKVYDLGAKVLNRRADLIKVADKPMGELVQQTHEAVHLGILDPQVNSVVYIHKLDSLYNLFLQSPIGKRNPLFSTSLGKALLAWRDDDDLDALLPTLGYLKQTPNTITDPAVLAAQLRKARQQGYAEECEESELGVRCMAVPVFDHIGKVVAAISVSFPVFRFDENRRADYVRELRRAGKATSEGLGFSGDYAPLARSGSTAA